MRSRLHSVFSPSIWIRIAPESILWLTPSWFQPQLCGHFHSSACRYFSCYMTKQSHCAFILTGRRADLECNPNAPETACCGRGSTCLSNGVCEFRSSSGIVIYDRVSCTDSTWRSTLCPQFCQSGEAASLTKKTRMIFKSGSFLRYHHLSMNMVMTR